MGEQRVAVTFAAANVIAEEVLYRGILFDALIHGERATAAVAFGSAAPGGAERGEVLDGDPAQFEEAVPVGHAGAQPGEERRSCGAEQRAEAARPVVGERRGQRCVRRRVAVDPLRLVYIGGSAG